MRSRRSSTSRRNDPSGPRSRRAPRIPRRPHPPGKIMPIVMVCQSCRLGLPWNSATRSVVATTHALKSWCVGCPRRRGGAGCAWHTGLNAGSAAFCTRWSRYGSTPVRCLKVSESEALAMTSVQCRPPAAPPSRHVLRIVPSEWARARATFSEARPGRGGTSREPRDRLLSTPSPAAGRRAVSSRAALLDGQKAADVEHAACARSPWCWPSW
jgi:hypothetical protein